MWYLLCYCNESAKKFERHNFCLLKVKLIFFLQYCYLPTSWNQTTMSWMKRKSGYGKKIKIGILARYIYLSLLSLPTTKKKQTVHLNFKSCFVRLFQEIFFWMVHTYICLSRAAGWQIRIPPMILRGIPSTSLEALVICTKKN